MRGEAEVHAVQLGALLAVKKALATAVSVWGTLWDSGDNDGSCSSFISCHTCGVNS